MTQFVKGQPRPAGAGRQKGSKNMVTREIREIMRDIVEGGISKCDVWLEQVAKDDPARAVELYLKMSEFVLPKISRTEVEHSGNATLEAIYASVVNTSAGLPKPEWFDVPLDITPEYIEKLGINNDEPK